MPPLGGQRLGHRDQHGDDHHHAECGDDPERDPPVRQLQDHRADQRPDDGGDPAHPGDHVQHPDQPRAGGEVDDHRAADDHGPAAGEALDEPGGHHHRDRRRERAPHGGERHHRDGGDQQPASAPLVRHRPADQLPERHADEERRQGELHLGRGGDRSAATCGNAGTYMSVASGAIAVRKTTVATSAEVSRARLRSSSAAGPAAGRRGTRSPGSSPGAALRSCRLGHGRSSTLMARRSSMAR